MDAFYGEIRIFGFTFAPYNWALCDGTTLLIQQNNVLYAVIGNQFGGNGTSTFALPNLQGSAVCSSGQGPGLTDWIFSDTEGTSTITLVQTQMPAHQHDFNAYVTSASGVVDNSPATNSHLSRTLNQLDFTNTDTFDTSLAPQMVYPTGASTPHENRQPYLVMNFCICMDGEFPVRT